MTEAADMEQRLRAAGAAWASEPAPDLAQDVLRRLRAGQAPRRARRRQPVLVAAALALVLLLAVPLLVPSVNSAVADFLGLSALRIDTGPDQPEVGATLRLGERSSRTAAARAVRFPFAVPAALGSPDAVWLDLEAVPGGQVTLVWEPGGGLPAAAPHGVGALLTALPGSLEPGLLAKSAGDPATTVTSVSLGDGQGWWVAGAPHALVYLDARGQPRFDRSRLAGATLLWQEGPTLYRLESALPLERALRIARSIPPGT